MRNGNLLVKADSQRQTENLLKMKNFYNSKYKTYPHARLNISKGIIRSRELALATEEMAAAMEKQGVTNIRRVSIKKSSEKVETNTYILTFNQPQIPKVVKIGYCLERVEQYVSAPKVLQMSEIWTPQRHLQRCQVWGKRNKSQRRGMLKTN